MTWKLWTFVALMVIEALMLVARIGRERAVVTPFMAIGGLVEYGLVVWLVLS